jgi:hypothetical protein
VNRGHETFARRVHYRDMHWLIVSVLMLTSIQSPVTGAQETTCAPPPEWGVTKTFEKWHVNRACLSGVDMLSVGAASEANEDFGFAFTCDKTGIGGLVSLTKINLDGPLSLGLKGDATPAMALNGIGEARGTIVLLEASPDTKRFEAALVDSPGPTFTLVLTPRGKPAVEMTFARAGLAAAVKPLRSKCAW